MKKAKFVRGGGCSDCCLDESYCRTACGHQGNFELQEDGRNCGNCKRFGSNYCDWCDKEQLSKWVHE